MDIDRVTLFVSSFSQQCVPCLHFIKQHSMPVQIIRLDTTEVRNRVRNGKYFQISNVPTLLVTYTDGNLQLFQGQPKILEWLNKVLVQSNSSSHEREPVPQQKSARRVRIEEPSDEEEEDEPQPPPKRIPKAKSNVVAKSKKKSPVKFKSSKKRDEDEEENVELILGDEDEPMESQTQLPQQTQSQSQSQTRPKRGTVKNNPLSIGKGKPSAMASLVEQARKMEEERKTSLGYDEKNLPRFG